MTSLLIVNAILSVFVLVVIVGMHAWAVATESSRRVAPKSRVRNVGPSPASARTASLSITAAE